MNELKYRFIAEGNLHNIYMPVSVALVDYEDVKALGITCREACERVAKQHQGPVAINIWDVKNAATMTSDGVMVDGSVVAMASSDYGVINKEFGYVDMLEISYDSDEAKMLIANEPHFRQWVENYPGKRFITHPDPAKMNLPVHQATITGRAGNNNAATEMMHYITMNELLMPLGGQIQLMRGGRVDMGLSGGVISVGIGMTVGEKYGRIVPNGHLVVGDTLHASGKYAKTLKAHIPCIAASKSQHAANIIKALDMGMVVARDIGPSPANIAVARAYGKPIAFERITERAWVELESVGLSREWVSSNAEKAMSAAEVIEKANEIIPGIEDCKEFAAEEVYSICYA